MKLESIDQKIKKEFDDLRDMITNAELPFMQRKDMFKQIERIRNCYKKLKNYKGKTVERSEKKTCHTNSLCSLSPGCADCLDCENYY